MAFAWCSRYCLKLRVFGGLQWLVAFWIERIYEELYLGLGLSISGVAQSSSEPPIWALVSRISGVFTDQLPTQRDRYLVLVGAESFSWPWAHLPPHAS